MFTLLRNLRQTPTHRQFFQRANRSFSTTNFARLFNRPLVKEMAIDREKISEKFVVRNIAFKGGGPKGIAYPSALEELSKKLDGLDSIERISGASAGSIMAVLVAVGYSPKEIKKFLEQRDEKGRPLLLQLALDGDDAISDDFVSKLIGVAANSRYPKLGILSSLIFHPLQTLSLVRKYYQQKGLCRGEFFENWINEKIREKIVNHILGDPANKKSKEELEEEYRYPTFGQLNKLVALYGHQHFKHLYVTTAELIPDTLGMAGYDVYSSESIPELNSRANIRYNPNLIIARTIRSSMSIPFFFTPIALQALDKSGKTDITEPRKIDGGVLNNYPVAIFDYNVFHSFPNIELAPDAKLANPETIGLFLYAKKELKFLAWFNHQIRLLWNITGQKNDLNPEENPAYDKNPKRNIKDQSLYKDDLMRHIMIDSCGVKLTDFDLSEDKITALTNSGLNAVRAYAHSDAQLLEEAYNKLHKEMKEKYQEYKKNFHQFTNISSGNNILCEHYQEPEQYITILKQLDADNNTLSFVGFGGTGKTELAKFVARRYLEACIWVYWRENNLQKIDNYPVVWIFDAEDPKQLWTSFNALVNKLQLPNNDNGTNNSNIVLEEVRNKLEANSHVLWIFNNVEFNQFPDCDALHIYWNFRLPKSALRIATTRRQTPETYLTPMQYVINLESGIGIKAANALLKEITGLANTQKIAEELHYLPLNLVVAGKYIQQQKRYNSDFDYLSHISKTGLADGNEPALKASIEAIKQFPDKGSATYQLLWFCSVLNSEAIPYELLATFVKAQQPNWNDDTINKALNDRIDLLLSYSLLAQIETRDPQAYKVYSMHRLIQGIVHKENSIDDTLVIESMRLYCAEHTKQIKNLSKAQIFNLTQHLDSIAMYYLEKNKYDESAFFYKEAYKIQEAYYGKNHAETLRSLNNLANLYEASKDYCSEIAIYDEILSIQKEIYGDTHKEFATTLKHLSRLYSGLGGKKEGEELNEQAEKIENRAQKKRPAVANYPSTFFENATTPKQLVNIIKQLKGLSVGYLFKMEADVLTIQILNGEAVPNTANILNLFERIMQLRFNDQIRSIHCQQNQIIICPKKSDDLAKILVWFKNAKLMVEINKAEENIVSAELSFSKLGK